MNKILIYRAYLGSLDISKFINITDKEIIQPHDNNGETIWCGEMGDKKYIAPIEEFSAWEFLDELKKIQEYEQNNLLL